MTWWLITLDVYVVCLSIVVWTIKTAPLIPASHVL
jgi:hypothetical protein